MKQKNYEIINSSKSRLATVDVGRFGHNKHYMFGLFEVDVTGARRHLRKLRQQGQEISFTAWMIKTLGIAWHGTDTHMQCAGNGGSLSPSRMLTLLCP